MRPPTAAEIDAARTPKGGWTRDQLAQWGVPWPPPRGWRRRLLEAAPEPPAALPLWLVEVGVWAAVVRARDADAAIDACANPEDVDHPGWEWCGYLRQDLEATRVDDDDVLVYTRPS